MPKIIKKLTEAEIRHAKPKKKPYRLYDGDDLMLMVRKSGTKVWQVSYSFHGKRNIYTIGQYSPKSRAGYVGSAEARQIRDKVKALVNQGIDPNRHKQSQQFGSEEGAETTFKAVAEEWHTKGIWAPKYKKRIWRSLEIDVFSYIGSKQVDQVTRQDLISILQKIEGRGALDVAKRVAQRCEAIIDYAVIKGLCDGNAAVGISKFVQSQKSKPRPHLKESQLPEFLHRLDKYPGRDYICLALKMLMLTFVRPGELRTAQWHEIDLENKLWRVPAEKMKMSKDHVVPLSKQVMKILEELKPLTGNSSYLFPSVRSGSKPITDVTLLKALKIMGYDKGLDKVVPHGFRHTASTILNEHRFNSDVIERQLAHVSKNKVRGVYNHAEYLEDRKKMMQWYADHLDKLKRLK